MYRNVTVTDSGDEKTFVEKFLQSLCAADSRITRVETAEEIAENYDSSQSFSVKISDMVTVSFKRQDRDVARFTVTFTYKNVSWIFQDYSNMLYMADGAIGGTGVIAARTAKYQIISNDKLILIRFGSYNDTLPLTADKQVIVYHDSSNTNNDFVAKAVNDTYYVGNSGTQCTKVTRLPYMKNTADLTQIEVIKNIALVNGSNEMVANPDGLWDSSTNYTTNVPLTIGTEQCCYLDTNTVMKC